MPWASDEGRLRNGADTSHRRQTEAAQKLRAYTEIAPDFAGIEPGAVWEDTKFGFSHLFDWERSALVTDVEWMKHAAKIYAFLGFLIPGEVRAFPTAEAAKAHEWIAENQQ